MSDLTRLRGVNAPLIQPGSSTERTRPQGAQGKRNVPNSPSFADMLRVRQGLVPGTPVPAGGELRFSAHAQTRIQSRQIALEPSHLDRLQGAVQRAASKGARDALVLMDDLAMVVSVTNRTVVTVVDKDNLKQNVFTNIDSAVIA